MAVLVDHSRNIAQRCAGKCLLIAGGAMDHNGVHRRGGAILRRNDKGLFLVQLHTAGCVVDPIRLGILQLDRCILRAGERQRHIGYSAVLGVGGNREGHGLLRLIKDADHIAQLCAFNGTFGALGADDGDGVVRLGGIIIPNAALLRADGEDDRRIQRHAASLAIFRPDATVSGDNIRVLGNGELQHCRGQRVRVGIGRDRDGVAGTLVFDRGTGDGQLHILQHAGGAGLIGIDGEDCRGGDAVVGGGHGEGGLVGILRVCRYLDQRVGASRLDLPAGQRVAITGGGGQGNSLALVDNRLGLCGGTVAHSNGSAAHGRIRHGGNTGKSTFTEVSRDGHFLAACLELHFCCIAERPLRAAGVD